MRTEKVVERLKNLSLDERKCLDLFFRSSFAFDGLGYTLFGDKPITATCYFEPKEKYGDVDAFYESVISFASPENLRIRRGWEIWKKYEKLFPMKKYAFVQSKNFIDNNCTVVLFINKKAVLRVLQENIDDFRTVLGPHMTPKLLLNQILKSRDVFGEVLKNHQGLIGILLGYGRNRRLSTILVSVAFWVLLSQISILFQGSIYEMLILTPEKGSKFGQNNPKKRRNSRS